jgi:hypothetical protein
MLPSRIGKRLGTALVRSTISMWKSVERWSSRASGCTSMRLNDVSRRMVGQASPLGGLVRLARSFLLQMDSHWSGRLLILPLVLKVM